MFREPWDSNGKHGAKTLDLQEKSWANTAMNPEVTKHCNIVTGSHITARARTTACLTKHPSNSGKALKLENAEHVCIETKQSL